MIQNQKRKRQAEDKMLWWLLTSQVYMRDVARDMTTQIQLDQTMNNGLHILMVVIKETTIVSWVDNSHTQEESKIVNASTEKILRE